MNEIEKWSFKTIERRLGRITELSNEFEPLYHTQGNFTVCLLRDKKGIVVSIGVTKRNPIDRKNKDTGRYTAFNRAVRHLLTRELPIEVKV